jgi:hypothetical protein
MILQSTFQGIGTDPKKVRKALMKKIILKQETLEVTQMGTLKLSP